MRARLLFLTLALVLVTLAAWADPPDGGGMNPCVWPSYPTWCGCGECTVNSQADWTCFCGHTECVECGAGFCCIDYQQ